ncbi:MAG TPA: hypothetical protein VFJ16_21885 [Longimicrobium sp.]|nr:hypothetical protein [Longimicrobium sp.]
MREEVPPIEPGKMVKGGWNRDLPLTRPRIVPKPYGIPFDPDRAEKVRRDTLAAEAAAAQDPPLAPVEPIQPGKMVKGGWNRVSDIPGLRPRMEPGPTGIPFDREATERIRRDWLARREMDAAAPGEPILRATTAAGSLSPRPLIRRPKSKPRRFFSRFYPTADRRHD